MTVAELIQVLERCKNPQAEVKVRVGWQPAPAHYTFDVVGDEETEPIIVCSYRVDDPEADTEEGRDKF